MGSLAATCPGTGHRQQATEELPQSGASSTWPKCGDYELWSFNLIKALSI